MTPRENDSHKRKLAESIAKSFADGPSSEAQGGEYGLSEAFAAPERRRLSGEWKVIAHRVDGEDYLERFSASAVKGHALRDGRYDSRYRFSGGLCVKRLSIDGLIDLPEGESRYAYRMGMALSWELGPGGTLWLMPEIGYINSSIDGSPVASRELGEGAAPITVRYGFEGEELVIEEGGDVKRLRRLA